ncbi:MAG: hypothetical protein Fur003_5740 [Candidatus Dojkabacteria bacterium]
MLFLFIGITAGMIIILDPNSNLDLGENAAENENGCVAQCTNKMCGNDGCGGSCGTCNTGNSCNSSGQCVANQTPESPESPTDYNIDMNADGEISITDLNIYVDKYKINTEDGHPYSAEIDVNADNKISIGDLTTYVYKYKVVKGFIAPTELLEDAKFSNGVAVGYANTYPNNLDTTCINLWKGIIPSYDTATRWQFIEISERFYLCDNPTSNPILEVARLEYISPNYGFKGFLTNRNGWARMRYNTGYEWRTGCNMCKMEDPQVSTEPPKYGNPVTNWPHFLVNQVLSPSYKPDIIPPNFLTAIPTAERVGLKKYEQLKFTGSFKLIKTDKVIAGNCPAGDWKPNSCDVAVCVGDCPVITNHALFYFAFVLWRTDEQDNATNRIYVLAPLMFTNDGTNYVPASDIPLVLGDQFGDTTYFAPTNISNGSKVAIPRLTEGGDFQAYDIDINALGEQALADISEAQNLSVPLDPADYYIYSFMAGWEIWGGFDTEVEMKDLSIKAM